MKHQVAVVGAGHWGKNLIRVFHQMGILSVVCDANSDAQRSIPPGIDFTSDPEDIFANSAVTAVVIATPGDMHHAQAKRALLANKDVFVEKPLCLSVVQGEELVRIAKEKGRILMVGHLLHYHPAVIAIKKMLKNNELGDLRFIHAQRMNFGKFRQNENVLWSFAPHDISVALSLTDSMPCEVRSNGFRVLSKKMIDVTSTNLLFPNDVRMHMTVGWISPVKIQRFMAVGSRKIAVFDGLNGDKIQVFHYEYREDGSLPMSENTRSEEVPLENHEPLLKECEHFIRCLNTRETPVTDGSEGVNVLKVLEACQKSMETNQPIICTP